MRALFRKSSLITLALFALFAWPTAGAADRNSAQPSPPRVLIIGDSISMGYTPATKKLLMDKANVQRIPGNAGHTGMGIEKLDTWLEKLGGGKWDVIIRVGHYSFAQDSCRMDRNRPRQIQAEGAEVANGDNNFNVQART